MAKGLIIIGAGGTGKQVAELVEDINLNHPTWNLLGYLDDDPKKQGNIINGCPVLGKINEFRKYPKSFFIVVLGNPYTYPIKKKVVDNMGLKTDRFAMLIHSDAYVSRYAKIDVGTIISPGVKIMSNVKIGKHVTILSNSYLGHDTVIEDYVTITNSVSIAGNARIREGCYLGANSSIMDYSQVGEWSLVGLGSVVIKDVPPFTRVVGSPARIIKQFEDYDSILKGVYSGKVIE